MKTLPEDGDLWKHIRFATMFVTCTSCRAQKVSVTTYCVELVQDLHQVLLELESYIFALEKREKKGKH